MDDLIRILIFLFFVWSIIGGIKSDKKKKAPQRKVPENFKGKVKQPLPSYKPPEEILSDMFGIKIPKTDEYSESYESKDLEKEVDDLENSKQVLSKQWNVDYDKLSSLENLQNQQIVEDYSIQLKNKKQKTNYSKVIIEKMKNRSSLKDAIIISEILNKPKSLRR